MSATVIAALERGDLDAAAQRRRDVDRQPRGEGGGLVAAPAWRVRCLDPALGVAGPGGEAASGGARAHGAILATSAASAAISRAAALCSASSKTRRPDCAASAKTTR